MFFFMHSGQEKFIQKLLSYILLYSMFTLIDQLLGHAETAVRLFTVHFY